MSASLQDDKDPSLEALEEFKCTFTGCSKVFKTEKLLKRHKIDDKDHDYCKKCDMDFESDLKHIIHRIATPQKHITCPMCGLDFKVAAGRDRHVELNHPRKQRIKCIACEKTYDTLSDMMAHIPNGQCRISSEEWNLERAERALQKEAFLERHNSEIGSHLSTRSSDISNNGGVSLLGHSTTTNNNDAALAEVDQLASSMSTMTTANGNSPSEVNTESGSVVSNDPSTLTYNSTIDSNLSAHRKTTFKLIDFYDKIREIYICPGQGCKRPFKDAKAFHSHLLSPAHVGGQVNCPSCLKIFRSVTGLFAHMESASTKCTIRHSTNYNQVLRELSAGVVATGGFHDDGTVKYIMPADEGWIP